MGDWLISRKRYWGLPLPFWECSCGHIEVIGSLKELKEKAIDKKKVDKLEEIHRPWIDEIKLKCKCGKEMTRVEDVGDAWLDAGIVPFSTLDYLGNRKYWQEWFPFDFICENMPGQYRGWFNALFWSSVTLTGKAPFKTILGYETLKDEKGEEMHKSKGNAIWFDDAVKKVGADPMRLLYCLQDPSQELKFGFNVLKEPDNNLNILYNLSKLVENSSGSEKEVEDKWIMSRLNSVIKTFTKELEELHPHLATRALKDFWLSDLSRGYVQIIRDRLSLDDKNAKAVLKEIYLNLVKLAAPVCPLITEKIWQELRARKIVREESVHLSSWPEAGKTNEKLEKQFSNALKIIEAGLAERDKAGIGLKWPLGMARIFSEEKIDEKLHEIIARQLNVKKIFIEKGKLSVKLDTGMTPELEAEGFAREITRKIQAERKKNGFVKEDKINLEIITSGRLMKMLEKQEDFIKERTNCGKIKIGEKKEQSYKLESEHIIRNEKVTVSFDRAYRR